MLWILLNPKVLHVLCATSGYVYVTWIHYGLFQSVCRRIGLQVLYLRPDTFGRTLEAVAFYSILGHSHTTEVILIQGNCASEKRKVTSFKARLSKCNIASYSLDRSL